MNQASIMECHKGFVAAAAAQGTQLDPSLLVNEGSQAEQIEARKCVLESSTWAVTKTGAPGY